MGGPLAIQQPCLLQQAGAPRGHARPPPARAYARYSSDNEGHFTASQHQQHMAEAHSRSRRVAAIAKQLGVPAAAITQSGETRVHPASVYERVRSHFTALRTVDGARLLIIHLRCCTALSLGRPL